VVRERVAASSVAEAIELLGPVAREDISALMARADVFCHPGYGEPFGTSAVEAMASGLPVVATDRGGLGEVVPGEAGIKVAPRDAPALAAALAELLGDREQAVARGARGRAHVEQTFAWPRVIGALEAALVAAAAGG